MVKHTIIWKLREELSGALKEKVKAEAKTALEALSGRIPGLVSIKLYTDMLPSSNGDMMLETLFSDASALEGYQKHPEHIAAADKYVRPFTSLRLCCDTETEE